MILFRLFTLLILLVSSSAISAQESQAMLREQAAAFIQSGKPLAAINCYDKLLALDSSDYTILFNRGLALEMCDEYAAAETAFSSAIKLDSLKWEAWYKRGSMRMKQHKTKEAIPDFDSVCRLDPGNAEAWVFAGKLLFNLDMLKSAISRFNHAIELKPSDASALGLRGRSYALLGDTAKAMRDLKMAVKMSPLDPEIRYFLAGLHIQKKRLTLAIIQLDTLAVFAPDFLPDVILMNHYFLFHKRMLNLLHGYYKSLLKTSTPGVIYARKAHVYRMLGFDHAAFKLYNSAVLRERLSRAGMYHKALLYLKIGKVKEAELLFNTVCEEQMAIIPDAFLHRGKLYYASGKLEEACRDFLTFRTLMKQNPPFVGFNFCKLPPDKK